MILKRESFCIWSETDELRGVRQRLELPRGDMLEYTFSEEATARTDWRGCMSTEGGRLRN